MRGLFDPAASIVPSTATSLSAMPDAQAEVLADMTFSEYVTLGPVDAGQTFATRSFPGK